MYLPIVTDREIKNTFTGLPACCKDWCSNRRAKCYDKEFIKCFDERNDCVDFGNGRCMREFDSCMETNAYNKCDSEEYDCMSRNCRGRDGCYWL
jgi:hypothetical protein